MAAIEPVYPSAGRHRDQRPARRGELERPRQPAHRFGQRIDRGGVEGKTDRQARPGHAQAIQRRGDGRNIRDQQGQHEMAGGVDRGDLGPGRDLGAVAHPLGFGQHGDHRAGGGQGFEQPSLAMQQAETVLQRQYAGDDGGDRLPQAVAQQAVRHHPPFEQGHRQGVADTQQGGVALGQAVEMLTVLQGARIDDVADGPSDDVPGDRVALVQCLPEHPVLLVEFPSHLVVLGALAAEHHDRARHACSVR